MALRPDRPVTMADVARAAGVSTALVSIVVRGAPGASEATRARVAEVAERLGYVHDRRAAQLRRSSSRTLGVVFELQQPFHGDLVEHVYAVAALHGYEVILSAVAPTRAERDALASLRQDRCEATILIGSRLSDFELADLSTRGPTVVVARRVDTPGVTSVRADDTAGIGLAVDHLVGLGHRVIAFVDGDGAPGSEDRSIGFSHSMSRHGLALDGSVVHGGLSEDDGACAVRTLLDDARSSHRTPPTAIIAFNDRCATGVVSALLAQGLSIPRDVSVMGYDDSRVAGLDHVDLTTVSQDAPALAEAAVAAAVAATRGERPSSTVLEPTLVLRSSTAPPPGA